MGRCIYCQKTFDFNTNGLTHIGIVPDMLDDFQSMDMTPSDFDPILDSATAYVRLWKYAQIIKSIETQWLSQMGD